MLPNGAPANHDISDQLSSDSSTQPTEDELRRGPKYYGNLEAGTIYWENPSGEQDSLVHEISETRISLLGKEAFESTVESLRMTGLYIKEEYGSPKALAEKGKQSTITIYGYTIGLIGGIAVLLEQLPVNENWRVKEAFNTLITTGSAWAVTQRVFDITNRIEIAASLAVALAVFSKNKVVEAPKEALYRWSEQGEKREEYRAEVIADEKDFRLKVGNNWRVAQDKKPKGMSKAEKLDYKYGHKIENAESKLQSRQKGKCFSQSDTIKAESKKAKLETELEARKEKIRLKEEKGKRTDNLGTKVVKVASKEMEDFGIALGLGAAIVVFNNGVRNRNYNYKNFIADTVKSSLAIASVSAFIAWTVATGTQKAKLGIPMTGYTLHYEDQAKFIVDYGLNTKAIIGALLAVQSPDIAKKLWHRMPKREAKFQQWLKMQDSHEHAVSLTAI